MEVIKYYKIYMNDQVNLCTVNSPTFAIYNNRYNYILIKYNGSVVITLGNVSTQLSAMTFIYNTPAIAPATTSIRDSSGNVISTLAPGASVVLIPNYSTRVWEIAEYNTINPIDSGTFFKDGGNTITPGPAVFGTNNFTDINVIHTNNVIMKIQANNLSMNNRRIVDVLDPTLAQDVATKNYVDNAASGWKTTGNSNLVNPKLGTINTNNWDMICNNVVVANVTAAYISMVGTLNLPSTTLLIGNQAGLTPALNAQITLRQPNNLGTSGPGSTGGFKIYDDTGTVCYYFGIAASTNYSLYYQNPPGTVFKEVYTVDFTGVNRIPEKLVLGAIAGLPNIAAVCINQAGDVTTNGTASEYGLKFFRNAIAEAYYMGVTPAGSFGIFNQSTLGVYTQLFEIGTGNVISYLPLSMGNNKIINVTDPTADQDAATKIYVDKKRCPVSLVPSLVANDALCGFVASASSTYPGYDPFNAFVLSNSEWATFSVTTNYSINITLPHEVILYKMVLTGRAGVNETMQSWMLQGSHDGIAWDTVYIGPSPLSTATQTFNIPYYSVAYFRYRLFAFTSTPGSTNPGLRYWEMFAYNF